MITDMTVTAGDQEHAATAARRVWDRGIRRIKVKVGALSPAEDVARLEAIRGEVPEARLLVDANGGYDTAGALEFLDGLAKRQIGLDLFEQPVPRDDWEGMTHLTSHSPVPICADESVRTSDDVMRLSRTKARVPLRARGSVGHGSWVRSHWFFKIMTHD